VNYDAKDETGKPLKRAMLVTISRRGFRKRIIAEATKLRISLEKEALARRNWRGRYEENENLRWLRGVPSVADLALEIAKKIDSVPKPKAPLEVGRALLKHGHA
jgi:hypothetical protein